MPFCDRCQGRLEDPLSLPERQVLALERLASLFGVLTPESIDRWILWLSHSGQG